MDNRPRNCIWVVALGREHPTNAEDHQYHDKTVVREAKNLFHEEIADLGVI